MGLRELQVADDMQHGSRCLWAVQGPSREVGDEAAACDCGLEELRFCLWHLPWQDREVLDAMKSAYILGGPRAALECLAMPRSNP